MRYTLATLILLANLAPWAAFGETGMRPAADAVARGAGLYNKNCVSCHGERGIGEGSIPPAFKGSGYLRAFALDETEHAWHHTDEGLAQMILEGSKRTTRMPAWKAVLSAGDARDIVAYIKSLWSDRILACQGPKHMSCMR